MSQGPRRAHFPEQHQSVAGLMAYFRRAIEQTRPASIEKEEQAPGHGVPAWEGSQRRLDCLRMLAKRRRKHRRRNQLRRKQRQHVRRKRGRIA